VLKIRVKKWGKRIDEKWGPKISLLFDYNSIWVAKIKSLSWDLTHRSWTGKEWELDASRATLAFLESSVVNVPEDILDFIKTFIPDEPEDLADNEVVIVLRPDNTAQIQGINLDECIEVYDALDCAMRYQEEGYEYQAMWANPDWDGWIRLFRSFDATFPIGLTSRAKSVLESFGYKVRFVDKRAEPEVMRYNFSGPELRDYQKEILKRAVENRRGIIALPTGAGKTLIGLNLINQLKKRALILVHRKELLYQWGERVEKYFGFKPGIIGEGSYSEKSITVAMLQSLPTKPVKDFYGVLIADECHHIPANTFQTQAKKVKAKYRYGLSATPWRGDGKDLLINAQLGEFLEGISVEKLVEAGFLAKPKFIRLKWVSVRDRWEIDDSSYQKAVSKLFESRARNNKIVDYAEKLYNKGHKVYVDVVRINHGRDLLKEFKKREIPAVFISGSDSGARRQEVLKKFVEDGFILISTLIKEGADLPEMTAVILAGGGRSSVMVIQTIGRALRPKKDNGNEALVVDLIDDLSYFSRHTKSRNHTFQNYYGELYKPEVV